MTRSNRSLGNQTGEAFAARSRKGAETRARLLAAAKTVFEQGGFLDARIADISKEAGLSHGAFYHYFDSKTQIFREVANEQEELLTTRRAASIPVPTSAIERIRIGNRRFLEHYRDEARIMGVIEEVSRYDEEVNAARAATDRQYTAWAQDNIQALQDEGVADSSIDAGIAAVALGAMVSRFAELWFVQGYAEYDFEKTLEQLSLMVTNALGIEEGSR